MAQAPGRQQLCIHKAPVALPIGHPERQQAPPLDSHAKLLVLSQCLQLQRCSPCIVQCCWRKSSPGHRMGEQ